SSTASRKATASLVSRRRSSTKIPTCMAARTMPRGGRGGQSGGRDGRRERPAVSEARDGLRGVGRASRVAAGSSPSEEHVVRRVRDAEKLTHAVARTLGGAASGIDALDGRHAGQRPGTPPLGNLELEPRDVFR